MILSYPYATCRSDHGNRVPELIDVGSTIASSSLLLQPISLIYCNLMEGLESVDEGRVS